MNISELKAMYDEIGTYAGVANALRNEYGEPVYTSEVSRALNTGTVPKKLRRLGNKRRYRVCLEVKSEAEYDALLAAIEAGGGRETLVTDLILAGHIILDGRARQQQSES